MIERVVANMNFFNTRKLTIRLGDQKHVIIISDVLFCSLAVLDPRVVHTMNVLSSFIAVLCHSDWLFHGSSCPRLDVVHPGRAWSSSPTYTRHCSLHYLLLQATPLFSQWCYTRRNLPGQEQDQMILETRTELFRPRPRPGPISWHRDRNSGGGANSQKLS